jgi:hypothetical protein
VPLCRRSRPILPLALWGAMLATAALAGTAGTTASAITAAAPTGIPAPRKEAAHRFGVYAWGFDDSAYAACDGCRDRLNWAADKVAATGSRTIRVYLGRATTTASIPP